MATYKTRKSTMLGDKDQSPNSLQNSTTYASSIKVISFGATDLDGDHDRWHVIRGTGVPTGQSLSGFAKGDLYINKTDGKLHVKTSDAGTDTWQLITSA